MGSISNTDLHNYMQEEFKSVHLANATITGQLGEMDKNITRHDVTLYNPDNPVESICNKITVMEEKHRNYDLLNDPGNKADRSGNKISIAAICVSVMLGIPGTLAAVVLLVREFIKT